VCTRRLKRNALPLLLVIAAGCGGPDAPLAKRDHPIVSTYHVADNMINNLGATFQGGILDIGTGVSDHGFYYGPIAVDPGTLPSLDIISLGPTDKVGVFEATATVDLVKGRLYYMRAYATSSSTGIVVFGQEMTFTALGSAAPTITGFNPTEGIAGDTIVITGTGFSSLIDNNKVRLGDNLASVIKSSPDQLSIIVPLSTVVGENNISVDVVGQKVTSTDQFNLLKMTITSFEPASVGIGDTVWFHGTNLPRVPAMSAGTIFQRTALTATSTRTLIGCVIANDAAVVSSDLTIVVGSQTAHFAGPITLEAPVITSIDPVKGPPGTTVHINGYNFNPDPASNKVLFGTQRLQVMEASRNVLTVMIPPTAGIGVSKQFSVTLLDVLVGQSSTAFLVTDH
jgi:hypothetical protein